MSISTLVIGVGGTGVLTLRALKKLYGKMQPAEGKTDERVPLSLLALDFDRSALTAADDKDRFAPLGNDEFFYLNAKEIQERLRNLDRGQDGELFWQRVLDWFPDRERAPIPASEVEANGAGQLRALGRLGFFLNDDRIETAIRQHLCDIQTEVDTVQLTNDKRVILVSSLAGGTGAGMMIDMAYVARRQEGRPRVYAYLLLPEVFQDIDNGGRIFQNTYGCLKELAYLKDQQIPFHADYYNIPPIHILPGQEEPFARLFLCRGTDCSGVAAIKESCIQIAETILPQLQRRIQEKALAVVNNTLSSNPESERLRRRTHCFSTAGSTSIDLTPIEPMHSAVFSMVVQLAVNPASKEKWFQKKVADRLQESRERLMLKAGIVPTGEPVEEARVAFGREEPVDERQIRRLAETLKRDVESMAKQGSQEIIAALKADLEKAEINAKAGTKKDIANAASRIEAIQTLLLLKLVRHEYEKNLELLKVNPEFQQVDKRLRDRARSLVGTLDMTLGIGDSLVGRMVFKKLSELRRIFSVHFPKDEESKVAQEVEKKQVDRIEKKKAVGGIPIWQRYGESDVDSVQHVFATCTDLSKILDDETLRANLESILTARAYRVLNEEVEGIVASLDKRLKEPLGLWRDLPAASSGAKGLEAMPSELRKNVENIVQEELGSILEEAEREVEPEEEPAARQAKLLSIIQKRVDGDSRLGKLRFTIPGDAEDEILTRLVRMRQQVFERRTPNPQRKGFALIMVPEGIFWPGGGSDDFRSFLISTATQVLNSRCQIEDYDGTKIWIYYEDLFNPPEHIRNIDEYYRSYRSQDFPEMFHIDRRMLNYPVFRDINGQTSSIAVGCGNPGCRENIVALPRSVRICPGCGQLIRSRCGNELCTENNLHAHPRGLDRNCPSCGELNQAAWWRCDKHGKVAVEVPIDKVRCPRCIEEHLKDPIAWPMSKISVRPDLLDAVSCPRCDTLNAKNPAHEIFQIPKPLLRFYRNGVNGHDRAEFFRLADIWKLPEQHRCPSCRTVLIPVHHQRERVAVRRRAL